MAFTLLCLLLCVGSHFTDGFFVDTEEAIMLQGQDASFGYQVAQLPGQVIVSAPLRQQAVNKTGQLFNCNPKTRQCRPISIPVSADDVDISLGLSLAVQGDLTNLIACGPTLQRTCGQNKYVNGRCYLLDNQLQLVESLPHSLPECCASSVDIVFLIDGSGSVKRTDFTRMLTFVSRIMTAFTDSDVQGLLSGRTQLFTPQRGSCVGSQKLLIVITDGETIGDNTPFSLSIGEAEKRKVLRYAIGVGDAFNSQRAFNELKSIGSLPSSDYVFRVNDFSLLNQIQNQLQEKIFAIEGTKSQSGSSFQLEMSQDGFSSILTSDGAMLGSVGAYDWTGGVSVFRRGEQESSWINITKVQDEMKDAYLGYSLLQVTPDLIAAGAPRYQHTGRVVIFKRSRTESKWYPRAFADNDKTGSYFGSVLSGIRINTDPAGFLLLVGAPTYYSPDEPSGCVFLCPLNARILESSDLVTSPVTLECTNTLHGDPAQVLGHFGSAISILPDLTGDQLPDLAVGAPYENQNVGAIYIFPGQHGGFRTSYIQRIAGSAVSTGLMYFGRSVTGNLDMTEDGIPDVSVGSEGKVLVLRSLPVLGVSVSMSFLPTEIPLKFYECPDPSERGKATDVSVCVDHSVRSPGVKGEVTAQLNYTLMLDAGRSQNRAVFSPSARRSVDGTLQLTSSRVCVTHSIVLPECVQDSLSPMRIMFNFSTIGKSVLTEDSPRNHSGQVSFQKDCGSDGVCIDDLRVEAKFTGIKQLVVGLSQEVNLTISVQNLGEDSYNARALISHPTALSYRKVSLIQSNRRQTTVLCSAPESQKHVTCGINSPVLRPNATVIFEVIFHVSSMADLGNTLTSHVNITSDNRGDHRDLRTSRADLRVLYSFYVTVSSLEISTKYTNFSSSGSSRTRTVEHVYRVINLGQRSLPVSVTFMVPVKIKETLVWEGISLKSSQPQITACSPPTDTAGAENYRDLLKARPVVDCLVATCTIIVCNITALGLQNATEFTVTGQVMGDWMVEMEHQKVSLQSTAKISYDKDTYHILEQNERFLKSQTLTVLEVYTEYNYVPVIIGSSIGGVVLLALLTAGLYKLGFFKRQYKEMMETPDDAPQETPGEKSAGTKA
ncbi:integrin alpha-M [Bombina bombina]|uniref:integrin alpha-M n=1 Tax=Bombina bombina TaxID=8345 RepID=UPI00235AEFEF|nr:integrin alpha-M [Bombina bombina]